jgi:hypothetical protein
MTVLELDAALRADGFTDADYSLSRDKRPYEGYILEKSDVWWKVLFSDRGALREIASFANETDACIFFYQKLRDTRG